MRDLNFPNFKACKLRKGCSYGKATLGAKLEVRPARLRSYLDVGLVWFKFSVVPLILYLFLQPCPTGSEPLTFEEECEMQETWKNSDDKCTFIILHRETFEDKNSNEIEAMIGDTNIFLKEEEGSKLGKSHLVCI